LKAAFAKQRAEVQSMSLGPVWSFLFALFLFVQSPAPVSQPVQFHEVDADSKTGEIRFGPFQSVHWRRLAERDMKDFNLSHPTPEQVAGLKKHLQEHPVDETGTSSEIHFTSSLETGMTRGFYYLVSGSDLQPLQLLRLSGTMRFVLNEQKNGIVADVFYGQIVAKTAPPPPQDAAFVVFSDSSLALTPLSGGSFTARKVAKQDSYEYTRDAKKWTLSVPDEGLFEVMSASAFKLGQTEYIYVKWKPDTENNYGGCDRQFSLFSVEQELRLVIASRSGCDA
jgi:hypothetical protein